MGESRKDHTIRQGDRTGSTTGKSGLIKRMCWEWQAHAIRTGRHLSPYTDWIKLIDPWLAPPMLLSPPISHLAPGDLKFPVFSIPFSRSFLLEYSCSRFTASLVHLLQTALGSDSGSDEWGYHSANNFLFSEF